MQGMENVNVFFYCKKEIYMMSMSSSFWIMHHGGGGLAVVSAKTDCIGFGRSFSQIFCPQSSFFCYAIFHNARTRLSHYNILACVTSSVWISEQTAIISLYSINWLVFITETECLLRGTDWIFIYNSGYVFCVDLRTKRIISLYNVNWLLFITETECVYCAVRTGSLLHNTSCF
jgi:hypothetical protein